MTNLKTRTVAAMCGGTAVFALLVGGVGAVSTPTAGMNRVSTAPPASSSPGDTTDDSGALRVHSAGGGGCVPGLNCGPINPPRPPPPRRQPSPAPDPQRSAPGPQNP